MILDYKNKKNKKEILAKASELDSLEFNILSSYLIFGENFEVLGNMLNAYRNKVDLIYIDPPYNTNRIFTVTENRSNAISSGGSGDVAYSDNLSRDQYFEFLRERIIVLRELLSDKGSIYLHIDYKIGHYVRVIMDEIFGFENFKNDISRIKSNPKNFGRKAYGNQKDMILFYSKNYKENIFNNVTEPLTQDEIIERFQKIEKNGRRYTTVPIHAPGETKDGATGKRWKGMLPPEGRHWRYHPDKLTELNNSGLIEWSKTGNPRLKNYSDEHRGKKIQDTWVFKDPANPEYPTEKNSELLKLIIEQSSLENSIVLDCFSGSGTTLLEANKLNRVFIGIDNSQIAIDTTKNKLKNIDYKFMDAKKNIVRNKTNPYKQLRISL